MKKDLYYAALVANIAAAGEVIKKLGAQSIDANELTSLVYKNISLENEMEEEYFKMLDELDDFERVIKSEKNL